MGVVLQQDVAARVIVPAVFHPEVGPSVAADALTEYIRSLHAYLITPEHYLHLLLVELLLLCGRPREVSQLLQYHGLGDSQRMSHRLLELASTYPFLEQRALDMMARRSDLGLLLHKLLDDGKLLPAIRLVRSRPHQLSPQDAPAVAFFSAAINIASRRPPSEASSIFFTLCSFYRQWNPALVAPVRSSAPSPQQAAVAGRPGEDEEPVDEEDVALFLCSPLAEMVPFPDQLFHPQTAAALRVEFGFPEKVVVLDAH